MGFIDKTIGGLFHLASNVGKAAWNVGNFAARYAVDPKSAKRWKPVVRSGFGRRLTGLLEWGGRNIARGGIATAKGIGRAVAGNVPKIPSAAAKAASFAGGVTANATTRAVGAANLVGRATSFMFTNELDDAGNVVRDINNLWTGKKMKKWAGWGLVIGGGMAGIASGASPMSTPTGPQENAAMPYNGLAASASGDLVLALHNTRRGR
jgi:hypothetical protein